jgi:hypothetical protein
VCVCVSVCAYIPGACLSDDPRALSTRSRRVRGVMPPDAGDLPVSGSVLIPWEYD